jgi:alkylhydroperoxidase family enzyme
MGLRRIEAEVEPRNIASRMLLRRLGFVREGLLREKWVDKGAPKDVVIHGLLKDDWTSRPTGATSQRIAPLDPPYPPEMQAAFDTLMRGAPPLKLFRTVARNPRVLQRMMAGGLLDRGSVSLRARELMILRTCARCGAEYEWGVHVATFGAKAQWTADELYSTVHGNAADPCWERDEDRLVMRLADELHATGHVRESLWRELSTRFAADQLVELVMLAGLYHAVSFMVNATGVEHESFAPKFPTAAPVRKEACSS